LYFIRKKLNGVLRFAAYLRSNHLPGEDFIF